jgi:hypothetical protein
MRRALALETAFPPISVSFDGIARSAMAVFARVARRLSFCVFMFVAVISIMATSIAASGHC